MNEKSFKKIWGEVLNDNTLSEVEEYGYVMFGEEYTNEIGQKIKITIYELEGKTYLIRYVDENCVQFRDITPLNHN